MSDGEVSAIKSYIDEKWKGDKDATREEHHSNVKDSLLFFVYRTSKYIFRVLIFSLLILFLWWRFGFTLGVPELYTLLFNFFYNFGGELAYSVSGVRYITFITLTIVAIIFIELVLAVFYIVLGINFNSSRKRYKNEVGVVAVFLLIFVFFFATNTLGITIGERISTISNPLNSTTASLRELFKEIKCDMNTECILNKKNNKELTQTSQTAYSISFQRQPELSFTLAELKDSGEWPLNYDIQAKGGKLFINSITCYQDKIDEAHFISKKDLKSEEIKPSEKSTYDKAICDLSKIKLNKTTRVKIIPVLEFTLIGNYEEDIPFINKELLTTTLKKVAEIKKKYPSESLESNSLFKVTRTFSPEPPLIFSNNEQKKVIMLYTFEKESSYSSFGKIKEATLDEITNLPSGFEEADSILLPKSLSVSKGKTSIRLNFNAKLPNEDKPVTIQTLGFKTTSKIARESDYFYMTITVPKEETQATQN